MFCNKCGRQIEDNRLLCDHCSEAKEAILDDPIKTSIEGISGDEAVGASVEEKTQNTPGKVFKGSKSNKELIYGAAFVGLAVLAVLITLLWEPISGLFDFDMKFKTPQEHFCYVEGRALNQMMDGVTAAYGGYLALSEKSEFASEMEFHIRAGDNLLALLSDYMETGEKLDLTWLSDVLLNVDSTTDFEMGQALITLGLGDHEVINADLVLDISKLMMWIAIPELSSTYLKVDLQSYVNDFDAQYDYEHIRTAIQCIPSEQSMNALLEKYSRIALSKITNVERKQATVTVDEISQECIMLVATVDEVTLIDMLITVLEEAKSDEQLVDMLEGILQFSSGESSDSFTRKWQQEIEAALKEVRDSLEEASSENYIKVIDYVDENNDIIGRHISISDRKEEFYYLSAKNGENYSFEANILDIFEVSGNGTDNSNGINATYSLDVEGMEFADIQLIEFGVNNRNTVRFIPSDVLLREIVDEKQDLNIALELIIDKNRYGDDLVLNVLLDDELFLGISADIQKTDTTAVEMPSNTIDATNNEELAEWIEGFDYESFIDNLGKAGLPEGLLDLVEQLAGLIETNAGG